MLASIPREVLAAALALALLWAIAIAIGRWRVAAARRRRFVRAREGEREAAGLLEAGGFAIEGAQVATHYDAIVDGDATRIELRADYVVTRQGRRYVAEVKTGRVAPRIETASTRRQLLEYRHAFDVDGVLLVDADARRIHLVELPPARPSVPRSFPFVGWAAIVTAVALALLLLAR